MSRGAQPTGRNRTIDVFRGVSIVLMVFFTVSLKLSSDLPDALRHNVRGSFHVGDLVLPMFLFASGLSLAYYLQNIRKEETKDFIRNVGGRFGKLALVGISLSFFSANGFLEMDEVMLCALCFIVCVALSGAGWKGALGITLAINLSYFGLIWLAGDEVFSGHYLGGYPAALYYLPVMLLGLAIGNGLVRKGLWCRDNMLTFAFTGIFLAVFLTVSPVDKLTATPSYMMLAVCVSFLILALTVYAFEGARSGWPAKVTRQLEYLGRTPLRYWLMMYVLFIIPATIFVQSTGRSFPLDLEWPLGIAISMALLLALWGFSYLIDRWRT